LDIGLEGFGFDSLVEFGAQGSKLFKHVERIIFDAKQNEWNDQDED
jgi:hypothetical protein